MLNNKYFGEYYPVKSPIHNLSIITKLVCLLLLLVPLIASKSLELHVVILFFMVMLIYTSKVPLRFYFNIIYGLRYLLIIFIVILAAKGIYLNIAVTYLIKIFTIILNLSLIFYTTSRSELKYGLEKIIEPLNFLNLKTSRFINKIINFISFIPLLLVTGYEVLVSSSSRGLDYFHTDILSRIIVVITELRNTFRLTLTKIRKRNLKNKIMLYDVKKYRTNLRINKFKFTDALLYAVHIVFVVYYIMEVGLV